MILAGVVLVALVALALIGLRLLRWIAWRWPRMEDDARAEEFARWKRAEFKRFVSLARRPPPPRSPCAGFRSAFAAKWKRSPEPGGLP
ncbi:MAG: hypothetical protein ACREMF_03115 [Gemmatimonadales bacterium]